METIKTIFIVFSILMIIFSIFVLLDRISTIRKLKRESTDYLETQVFDFVTEYFSFIGEEHPEVVEFKKLLENHDLNGLKRNWKRLDKVFRKLEVKAGHQGRPLIMDYYLDYGLYVNELIKRKNNI